MRKDGKITRHRKGNCSICFSCIICKPPPWCTLVSHDTAKKSVPSKRMATELDSLETDLLPEKKEKTKFNWDGVIGISRKSTTRI